MSQEKQDAPRPVAARERRTSLMLVSAVVAAILAVAAVTIPVPYVVESPGPAINTIGTINDKAVVQVTGTESFPPASGTLDLTTVSMHGGLPDSQLNLFDAFKAWLTPSSTLYPAELVYAPGTSSEAVTSENTAAMTSSQENATAAALTALDIAYQSVLSVGTVPSEGAASGLLQPGDELLTIAAQPITDITVIRDALAAAPGQPLAVEVVRDGAQQSVTVTPRQGEDGSYLLGITLRETFVFPFQVDITLSNIGGPSAGMIFSLAIMDFLTEGELTGGKNFAGTGTIEPNGAVGPIGGIAQKMIGARDTGADYFLAPAANCSDVLGHIPDGLSVIRVETLQDAYDSVAAIGSGTAADTLPGCS